jgi:hypothetical protein
MATEYRTVSAGDGGEWGAIAAPATPPPPRRLVARTRTIDLGGDYAGWTITVRRNAPMGVILRLDKLRQDSDFGALLDIIPEIVTAWNFVDEDGEPIPCTPEGMRLVPVDLFRAVTAAFNEALAEGADVSPN